MSKAGKKAVSGKHQVIAGLDIGDSFSGVYYVNSAHIRKTVQNKDFTDLELRDKSGSRRAKFWGVVPEVQTGGFAFCAGAVEDYMGSPSIVLANLEGAEAPKDLSDYLPVYDEDVDDLTTRLDVLRENLTKMAQSEGVGVLSEVVEGVYGNGAFFNKVITVPGSTSPHYGCQGGLLANIVRVAELTEIFCQANKDIIPKENAIALSAALLLLSGGVDSYEFKDCLPVMTTNGELLGCTSLTSMRVATAWKRIHARLSKDKNLVSKEEADSVIRMMHVITTAASAVNGGTEVPVLKPMTKEAVIVAAALRSDLEIVAAIDFVNNDSNVNEPFTAWDPVTRRKYYRG